MGRQEGVEEEKEVALLFRCKEQKEIYLEKRMGPIQSYDDNEVHQ